LLFTVSSVPVQGERLHITNTEIFFEANILPTLPMSKNSGQPRKRQQSPTSYPLVMDREPSSSVSQKVYSKAVNSIQTNISTACQECQRYFSSTYLNRRQLQKQALNLYQQGEKMRAISRILGVSPQTVSNWVKAKTSPDESV
jgi:hypothetical protein